MTRSNTQRIPGAWSSLRNQHRRENDGKGSSRDEKSEQIYVRFRRGACIYVTPEEGLLS